MLATLDEVLKAAEEKKMAIGAFNTPNLESIQAVIGGAEELNVPVIIMHAEVHEDMSPMDFIGKIMIHCAREAKVPVCVHLDHGEHVEYVKRAIDLGFTSVMYDGSSLAYEENVKNTRTVVEMAHAAGVSVEAEIGTLGKREMGYHETEPTEDGPKQIYTNPDDARRFVRETGIDALACSFGTAHGLYLKAPVLDMNVLDAVREAVGVPLVMHGGSGVSVEDYRTVIQKGIRKINYFTYMSKAGGEAIADFAANNRNDQEPTYFHDVAVVAAKAMKENVVKALNIFSGQEV